MANPFVGDVITILLPRSTTACRYQRETETDVTAGSSFRVSVHELNKQKIIGMNTANRMFFGMDAMERI
jgi:hypothetical protein